jgi:undecaprenyl-phosphate 4-deoxy-4-formamido-L-arabinose transferase
MSDASFPKPDLSIVVPVYNEQENLADLHRRITEAIAPLGRSYEIVLVDDGSRDRSLLKLRTIQGEDPGHVRVVELLRNFGQHAAVFAGFSRSRGEIVVTLDADLQNPPEEIPVLLRKIEEGFDVVGGFRREREDSWFRRAASRIVNRLTARATGVKLRDYGCMLRAYRRPIVEAMVETSEISTFIPALANTFARDVAEVEVAHAPRQHGRSKYSMRRLLRLNFDLMTGFSTLPLQFISWSGALLAIVGFGFGLYLLVRRILHGPEVEGVFTLFALLFAFLGVQLFCLGMMGEYVGRIYSEVRHRPRFLIRRVYEGHIGRDVKPARDVAQARDTAKARGAADA